MLYSQPLATRFGIDLAKDLNSGHWSNLDIAVAWVRASGINHLRDSLEKFLQSGAALRIVVGVDLDNTTKDGLQALLDLGKHGNVSLYVYHNESGGIFHPKVYLFRNAIDAKLIVGSNNLTQAGLFQNTEAGLSVVRPSADVLVGEALDALNSWTDTGSSLVKVLDDVLLAELVSNGYVKDEAAIRAELASRKGASKKQGAKKLFGGIPVSVPASGAPIGAGPTKKPKAPKKAKKAVAGTVLLMRVRKARGTQVQLPIKVVGTFFGGSTKVKSAETGDMRNINPAKSGGSINTMKFEIPESATMNDPVVRFEKTKAETVYQAFDANSAKGKTIMSSLRAGLKSNPVSTFLTRPADPDHSTWWRFI